nr:VTT domain-containing protein [Alcanivorax sp. 1008]
MFSVAGALLFGKLYGFFAVWIAANIAVNASFWVVRLVGGQLLDEVKHPLILKMTDRLYEKPVQTIAILRLFLFTAPGLNTVLALSRVRGSDHLWGSLLGAIVPTAMVVMMTDWVLTYFYDLPPL